MPTLTDENLTERFNFSGGMQRKTSKFLKRTNEVDVSVNAHFGRIGAISKTLGMSQLGNAITETTTSTSTSTSTTSSSSTSSSSTTTA